VELADGRKVVADENYIRESILQPQAKIVKGFQPIMPSFQGQLTEEQISDIIEFIKTLK
jgi:cytochrome c oxidase subunit 2